VVDNSSESGAEERFQAGVDIEGEGDFGGGNVQFNSLHLWCGKT